MSVKYIYSVSVDTLNSAVDPGRLAQDIEQSTIITALSEESVQVSVDVLDIWFKVALSTDDETTLNTVVGQHTGVALLPDPEEVIIAQARYDDDDKQVVVITPAPRGSFTWYTSHSDQLDPPMRGAGDIFKVEYTVSGTGIKSVESKFIDSVYIHDGEIQWAPIEEFGVDDIFSVYIKFPATTVTEDVDNVGNCNLYNIGGPYNAIVPNTTMEGTHNVDLDTAVPLPDSSGYWYVNEKTNIIAPGIGTSAFDVQCALLDFPAPNMYLIRNVSMISSRGLFEIDAYLVEWVSPRWGVVLEVDKKKVPQGDISIVGTMMLFRWEATI